MYMALVSIPCLVKERKAELIKGEVTSFRKWDKGDPKEKPMPSPCDALPDEQVPTSQSQIQLLVFD